jgi:hypothetical protein
MAIDKGYIVDTIYEIWHFDHVEQYDPRSKTGGIFTEYIGGRTLHLISPSYVDRSPKFSVTIFGCPRTTFPVLLIYGYSEVTS